MDPKLWQFPLGLTISILFCIVMLRAGGTYALGRAIAAGTAKSRWSKLLDTKAYRVAATWLDRWGPLAVSFSFLTVGLQTMIHVGAGVGRMPLRRYLPALALGSLIWAVMYGTVGFIGFVAIARLWAYSPLLTIAVGVLAVAAVLFVFWRRPAKNLPMPLEQPAAP